MYQKNPSISKGIDWLMVGLYALIVIIGLLCIFSVEHRTNDNITQNLLGFKKNYPEKTAPIQRSIRLQHCPTRKRRTT